ncbi:MAG: GNAT family N-acetyltransferase [Candidatus Yanofskybacteria bacterium]|nr:GNAT family N-acetyltransferase [Candidatus Yanofskybacteria bacterium]
MDIRLGTKQDARQIAELHKHEIASGFLASLPVRFLAELYKGIMAFPGGFCVVAAEDEEVIGFVAGITNVKSFYKYFLTHAFHAGVFLLPLIIHVGSIKRIIENLFYPVKTENLPQAELLSIAVKHTYQGKGIAPQMFPSFLEEMRERNVGSFKLVVGQELAHAIRLYEKLGFRFARSIVIHGGEQSKVYIYDIS